MEYSDLLVVAARATGETGVAISNPTLKAKGGEIFLLRDVNVDNPVPDILTNPEGLEDMIRSGFLVATPEWPAEKGRVVVVVSARLADIATIAGFPLGAPWCSLAEGSHAAYLPCGGVKQWTDSFVDKLLTWADSQVQRWLLAGKESRDSFAVVEEPYRHARFLCSYSKEREHLIHLFVSWGVFLTAGDPDRWQKLADTFAGDLDVSRDQLDEMVLAGKNILTSSKL